MTLIAFDKLVIVEPLRRVNGRVIGLKIEQNGSVTYLVEPLTVDFYSFKNGSRIMRINSADIDTKAVNIEKHIV